MPDPSRCNLHEQALNDIMKALAAAAAHQAATTEAVNSLRREMDAGFGAVTRRQDIANGRVTTLEGKVGRLEADAAAQDAFTPGLFKALDDMASKKTADHERIWKAIERLNSSDDDGHKHMQAEIDQLKASDAADQQRVARNEGWLGGATKIGALSWVAFMSLCVFVAWLLDRFIEAVRTAPGATK